MKRPQWITFGIAVLLVAVLYKYAPIAPVRKKPAPPAANAVNQDINIDTILLIAKKQLTPEQGSRITGIENSIVRGAVRAQQLSAYHQLAHFWGDTMQVFEPYAWYEAEAARLENSEKSLTFAAHLFLNNLQEGHEPNGRVVKWKALQAKDLFERSLRINPENDSSKVGLGACYLFGNISSTPMEGITRIREVAERDSTNVYAQMMLAKGSLFSEQLDKAISRLNTVYRLQPDNVEAILLLADVHEGMGDKTAAAGWYRKSLQYIQRPDMRADIEKRIADLTR